MVLEGEVGGGQLALLPMGQPGAVAGQVMLGVEVGLPLPARGDAPLALYASAQGVGLVCGVVLGL